MVVLAEEPFGVELEHEEVQEHIKVVIFKVLTHTHQ